MKKELKGFLCGILVSGIVGAGAAYTTGIWESIDVLRNDINVVVNGQQILADNFLYNDTTYLPLRAIGEALDKDVQYDEQTNTAIISEKGDSELTENINKYTPPDFMLENEDYIRKDYNGKYIAGAKCIAYYTDPMGFSIYAPNESNELIFYRNDLTELSQILNEAVYRYQYGEDRPWIYYDELMDEIIPALEALQ